ncbi:MAG: ATP-binding cassette domain-containing protein [Alphaproteobacteria bacterium]|nr:ATP-binding cassette domain-containing protein [Alphaproteobacteria bacterium]MCW5743450.1 ATP-binding cassette domain-containing protein [Alphaproteobacteria bacterium]
MDSNLFKYVWRNSRSEQLIILGLVILAQVFYFASLNIPKTIVNDGIEGKAFRNVQTVPFLRIDLPIPSFISDAGSIRLFDGLSLAQWPYLVGMSCLFLVMVTINGLFKKTINTQKGRMGERMLRRLRYQLYDRILLFPPAHFRKVKQAELAGMINNEIEPLGGFIGDAYVQPAFLGGQAITALLFIMLQNIWLGVIVISILAVQAFVIPKLRRRIVALAKQRQITARQFSGRVAETVDGVQEVHVHAASNYERADIVDRLGRIFHIRFELFQRKFTAKFLNNLLAQTTPFLIYLIGGYFVLFGDMQVGAVVGVLLAYKDLPGPVKELIDWDQQRQEMQQRYEQVIEQFEPEGMLPPDLQTMPDAAAPALGGEVRLNGVVVAEEGGARALDGVTLSFPLGRKVAVVGGPGGGKEALAQVVARVVWPTGGGVAIGGKELSTLPEATAGARLSYVGQDVYLLPVTIRDNILYALKFRPRGPAAYNGDAAKHREIEEREAKRAGNPPLDVAADWVDYEAAGASGPDNIDQRIIEALRVVELEGDVYRYGLRGTIDPAARPAVVSAILEARRELHKQLEDSAFAGLVEPFDRNRYNRNMSVAENVLFGTPMGRTFDPENITANPYMRRVLNELDLATPLAEMGVEIARTMVELFADLPAGHPFFEQFSFLTAEELPEFRALITRLSGRTVGDLSADERTRLRSLPFRYIEARHRLGLIDEAMEERLLAARHAFASGLPAEYASAIEFYDKERYNGAATLQDNILFGRLVYGQAQGADRVGDLITEVLDGLQMRHAVVQVGLDYNVGVAGKRLSAGQRQKVGIARALVKRPDLLVLNEPTAVLDAATQQRLLDKILAARGERGVLWTLSRTAQAEQFDEVIVMQGGRMTARGVPSELSNDKTFTDLLAAG